MSDDPFGSDPIPFLQQADSRLLGWLRESKEEGERINRMDPAFEKADQIMRYIQGDQLTGDHPNFLHKVVVNQVKKAVKTHVSALTDLKPLFAWQTHNDNFQQQSAKLNQLNLVWWINATVDKVLADVIKYSLACGSGDMVVEYDPYFMGGDNRVFARDPRDTLPIHPSNDSDIQSWQGLTIREMHSIARLKAKYPGSSAIKEDMISPGIFSRFRRMILDKSNADVSTLDGLGKTKDPRKGVSSFHQCMLNRTFLQDRSINDSPFDIVIGKPGTNYSYIVKSGERRYPRGRLIVWTDYGVLSDGPNPYWHGMYPVCRLQLDPWPWLFMGLSLMHDLIPAQDILNNTINDILQVFSQNINRGSIWDKQMPQGQFERFDPRRPHWKVKKPNQFSDGFKLVEGPQLPPWSLQFLEKMFAKFDELSGTANLAAFMQLRQMPGKDTIEKYMEALTPEIRLEGRQVEIFLRSLALMLKGNIFQFYSKAKRLNILGDAGVSLNELDYDPDTMVPALNSEDKGYTPELDASLSRDERAKFFMHMFTFYIEPNSILAINAQERKMMLLQLSRMGYVDFWTLMKALGIPEAGDPPTVMLPVLDWKPNPNAPGVVQPPMEPRKPQTITERLMAQNQLGIGMTENASGRKASGQEPPQLQQKSDGRTTMTES